MPKRYVFRYWHIFNITLFSTLNILYCLHSNRWVVSIFIIMWIINIVLWKRAGAASFFTKLAISNVCQWFITLNCPHFLLVAIDIAFLLGQCTLQTHFCTSPFNSRSIEQNRRWKERSQPSRPPPTLPVANTCQAVNHLKNDVWHWRRHRGLEISKSLAALTSNLSFP